MGIKVKVIREFKHPVLKEILPKDFETKIEPKPYGYRGYNGFTFIGANGLIYGNLTLSHYTGFTKLENIFEKI